MFDAIQPYISSYIWLDRRLLQRVLAQANGKVLDVGCGNKRLQQYLPAQCEYIGIDFNPLADQHLDISTERYPFADDTFDFVICNAVLEHVADERFVLQEIYRVLKPGGKLYVSIPFLQPYHPDPEDYRRFTTVGLGHVLQRHGFTLIEPLGIYGTMLTIEYLTFAEFGKMLKRKHNWFNPARWLHIGALGIVYVICKIGNIVFRPLERNDDYVSPGASYLCRK
ncbi:MAG: class I SAM-dependent methyltransferase [Candidatus Kerfeldbacteria bacterium]|nr:class I SAM-dependent methyltransferase [Candidatus Kerfeldbacteria bacterium]